MLLYLYFLLLSVCLLWVCCLRQYRDIKINSHPLASVLHQGSSSALLKILWSWNFWELHILDAADENHSSIMLQSSHLTQNHLKPSCNPVLHFHSLYSLVSSSFSSLLILSKPCSDHPAACLHPCWTHPNFIGPLQWILFPMGKISQIAPKAVSPTALTQSSCVLYQFLSRYSRIIFLLVESVRTLLNKLSFAITPNLISSNPQPKSFTNLQCFKICHCKISLIAQIQNTAILNLSSWKSSHQQILIIITQDNIISVEVSPIRSPLLTALHC